MLVGTGSLVQGHAVAGIERGFYFVQHQAFFGLHREHEAAAAHINKDIVFTVGNNRVRGGPIGMTLIVGPEEIISRQSTTVPYLILGTVVLWRVLYFVNR